MNYKKSKIIDFLFVRLFGKQEKLLDKHNKYFPSHNFLFYVFIPSIDGWIRSNPRTHCEGSSLVDKRIRNGRDKRLDISGNRRSITCE